MRERISALMDGELEEGAAATEAGAMRTNAELRDAWNTYHLIGDALRGDLYPSLQDKVAARLAGEPTVLAPQRRSDSPVWKAARYALSAAAGIGGVALVVWTAGPVGPQTQMVAKAPAAVTSAKAVEPKDVEHYVVAHRPYAVQNVRPVQFEDPSGAASR